MWPLVAGRTRRHRRGEHTPPLSTWASTRDQQHEHHGDEQPVEHEAEERQLEHVEADVGAELGVGAAERLAVAEQQPRLPLRRGREGEHDREHAGAGVAEQPQAVAEHLVEALDVGVHVGREAASARAGRRSAG